MSSQARSPLTSAAGYSLIELLISMGIFTVIMGATLGGLSDVMKGNQTVLMIAGMNNSVRTGLDFVVRDMLQVGSGLPAGHSIAIASGAGSTPVRIPGPPTTNITAEAGAVTLPAIYPLPGRGPTINGVSTDVVMMLMADNAFLEVLVSATSATTVTVAAGPVLDTGPDRVVAGQLMMISKGSMSVLVQVTTVNYAGSVLTFANGDSLNLNQSGAAAGTLAAMNAVAPVNSAASLRVSRVRMVTYYLDATTVADHPRLVRRANNGSPTTFDNTSGTAVGMDIVNLQLTYDISNGTGNPGNVEMVAADLTTSGACAPNACGVTQIRKVNIALTGQTQTKVPPRMQFMKNTLESQVSLRGMAFVDRYR